MTVGGASWFKTRNATRSHEMKTGGSEGVKLVLYEAMPSSVA